ncbi:recombinase family protein [Pseudalkalibacillus sp. NRS-1564]|uniref:recombinase family protein n=1 Tax=Pseudalkalibacillus sp. NRS-1564 TaxID=3233900 RepID=UPI003D27F237
MVEKRKGIGYLRKSDHKQNGNNSFEIQKREILNKAEEEGYEIILWCVDKAVSAYSTSAGQRKGLKEAMNNILKDEAEAIFFYEESRIDRSIESFVKDVYLPLKNQKPNCKFYSTQTKEEWNPNDVMTILKLIFAGQESIIKSLRSIDTQKASLSKKIRPGGRAPFGYTAYEQKLYPNEDAVIVRFIFYLSSWGYSNEKIALLLNNSDAPSPNNKGWHKNTIASILNRMVYAGHLTWNVRKKGNFSTDSKHQNELFLEKNVYEAIIPPEVLSIVEQIKKLKTTPKQFDTPFLFRGILTCDKCDEKLTTKVDTPAKSKNKYLKYRCNHCKKKH